MGKTAAFFRLVGAARVFARHDALVPEEFRDQIPFSARLGARLLRLTTFGGGKGGRLGERFTAALGELGPSYVKLGQFLATRPDIVGKALAGDLAALQDRMPPFPQAEAKAMVAAELGKPADTLFESFSEPVAAASIAQVHRARAGGRDVAVKVLRPDIEGRFRRDLEAFYLAARLAERFAPASRRLRPVAFVDTLAASVREEMDLRLEASAAAELAERTKGDAGFRVPRIEWELTAKRVLTSEWIDALPLRDPAALRAAGHDPARLANLVIQHFLTQALRDGFFHADMHQGNLFVDAAGNLVAVDFGIMGRLDPVMRRFMADVLYGFLQRDYKAIAEAHFAVGIVAADRSVDAFAQALRAVGERVFGRPASEISMARLLQQLFEITDMFGMEMQPQLVWLQKTMVVVEGVARDLDPEHNIWEASRPVVERWMKATLSPETRLREAAEGIGDFGRTLQGIFSHAAQAAASLTQGGVRLHPDSAAQIAEEEVRRTRHVRWAIWLGALALAAIALRFFL
ncbi:MAG: 2-polyprenylphenol 6-hydroxylase [Alphaproteobacteria bacterium]